LPPLNRILIVVSNNSESLPRYFLAFRNFDADSDGWISYTDVIEILTQYVDAFVDINNGSEQSEASSKTKKSEYPAYNKVRSTIII
jgi:Ca2+-binding EF-hand superfamily protein